MRNWVGGFNRGRLITANRKKVQTANLKFEELKSLEDGLKHHSYTKKARKAIIFYLFSVSVSVSFIPLHNLSFNIINVISKG